MHAGYISVVNGVERRGSVRDGMPGQISSGAGRAIDNALAHGGEGVVGHESLSAMLTCEVLAVCDCDHIESVCFRTGKGFKRISAIQHMTCH
jgi:hypothetical protein